MIHGNIHIDGTITVDLSDYGGERSIRLKFGGPDGVTVWGPEIEDVDALIRDLIEAQTWAKRYERR